MSTQQALSQPEYLQRDHLTVDMPAAGESVNIDRREAFCTECGNRVTASSDGTHEYGHQRGRKAHTALCPHHCHGGDLQ